MSERSNTKRRCRTKHLSDRYFENSAIQEKMGWTHSTIGRLQIIKQNDDLVSNRHQKKFWKTTRWRNGFKVTAWKRKLGKYLEEVITISLKRIRRKLCELCGKPIDKDRILLIQIWNVIIDVYLWYDSYYLIYS